MLMSLKEAQELFTKEFEETAIGLSKFCSLGLKLIFLSKYHTMFVSFDIMKTSTYLYSS